MKFPGADGRIEVEPSSVGAENVTAKVPTGATSGKVVVVTRYGAKAKSPDEIKVKPEDAIRSVNGFAVRRADAQPKTAYFDGKKDIALDYLFEADGPADIRVDIVSKKSGKTIDSMIQRNRQPFSNQTVIWDGLDAKGKPPRNGKYRFKVTALGGEGGTGEATGFAYYDYKFPLRGRHITGTASAPAAAIRARTSSPSAGPRSSPPAAARSRPTHTSPPPATTSSSTARRPARTTSTCTWRRRAARRRAHASRPAR